MDDDDLPTKPESLLSDCCAVGGRLIALQFSSETVMEFEDALYAGWLASKEELHAWLQKRPPAWFVVGRYGGTDSSGFSPLIGEINPKVSLGIPIAFCPFCGERPPEIEWNPDPPTPIELPLEAGRCSTCHERHCNCSCWPLVHLWRIKP